MFNFDQIILSQAKKLGNFQVVKAEPLIDLSLALSICLLLWYQFIKLITDYSLYNAAVPTSLSLFIQLSMF